MISMDTQIHPESQIFVCTMVYSIPNVLFIVYQSILSVSFEQLTVVSFQYVQLLEVFPI